MRRYWISPQKMTGTDAVLDGELFHHVIGVCRLQRGDRFELLHGDGKAYFVELQQIGKKQAIASVLESREVARLPKPYIHLCVSVPRFQKIETILEKAVELGVHTVVPFVSDFSFVKTINDALVSKRTRWLKIIQSATEQCGRGEVMALAPPETLESLLESFNRRTNAAGLFPYEGEAELEIKDALESLHAPSEIWLFVGSEGGFSHKEVDLFRAKGLKPVTLGPQILRVETACLALVSVLKYHFHLMRRGLGQKSDG